MAADQVDDWLRQLCVDRRDACLLAILHEGGSQVGRALYQNGMVAPLTLAYDSLQNRHNRRLHGKDGLSAAKVSSQDCRANVLRYSTSPAFQASTHAWQHPRWECRVCLGSSHPAKSKVSDSVL